jgi:hypothetical protein
LPFGVARNTARVKVKVHHRQGAEVEGNIIMERPTGATGEVARMSACLYVCLVDGLIR